jgi:hypothetical protein
MMGSTCTETLKTTKPARIADDSHRGATLVLHITMALKLRPGSMSGL